MLGDQEKSLTTKCLSPKYAPITTFGSISRPATKMPQECSKSFSEIKKGTLTKTTENHSTKSIVVASES